MLAATQKPSSDVIPTHIRDLFSMRWALRCATPQASDTVLGQGWATAGYSASTVDAAQRGVGFLLHEGATPTRCRGFHLSDADLAAIAERAAQLPRSNHHDDDSGGGNDADDEADEPGSIMSGTDKGSGAPAAMTQTDWGMASGRGGSVAALLALTSDWARWERFSELAA